VDRLPLVTLGLAAVLALAFVVVELGFASHRAAAWSEVAEAVDFAIENPGAQVPERLVPAVAGVLPGFDGNRTFAFLGRGKGAEAKQAQLDARAARAFELLDTHPHRGLGLVPAGFAPWALGTHVLVHAGVTHLLLTLLLLLVAGPPLEEVWGRRAFAAGLALFGVVGAGAFSLVHASADRALVGASCLAVGLAAAAAIRFRGERLDLLVWAPLRAEPERIRLVVPSWTLAVAGAGYAALLTRAVPGALPAGVDNAVGTTAQVAAALVGGGLAELLRRSGLERRLGRTSTARVARSRPQRRFDLAAVRRARDRGDADAAWSMLLAEVRRSCRNRDVVMLLWEMATARGEIEEAAPALRRHVAEELRRGAVELAVAHWRELAERAPDCLLDASVLARLVPVIEREDGAEMAVLALQQALDPSQEPLAASVALEISKLALPLERALARKAALRALGAGGLEEVHRAELEALVAEGKPAEEPPASDGPRDLFYEESDRTLFGEVGDLSTLVDPLPEGAVTEALPRALGPDGIVLVQEGRASRLAYDRITALAVAGVRGLCPQPVVLVDLVLNQPSAASSLRVVRLRSDRYDPCALVPGTRSPLDALCRMVDLLLERSHARALPDRRTVRARPVRVYASVQAYETEVLWVASSTLLRD
jgi:membrane associated rhomboid family serine protease